MKIFSYGVPFVIVIVPAFTNSYCCYLTIQLIRCWLLLLLLFFLPLQQQSGGGFASSQSVEEVNGLPAAPLLFSRTTSDKDLQEKAHVPFTFIVIFSSSIKISSCFLFVVAPGGQRKWCFCWACFCMNARRGIGGFLEDSISINTCAGGKRHLC